MYIYDVSPLDRPRFAMTLNKNQSFSGKYLLYIFSRLIPLSVKTGYKPDF